MYQYVYVYALVGQQQFLWLVYISYIFLYSNGVGKDFFYSNNG